MLSYFEYVYFILFEWEFFFELLCCVDCGLFFDVNNIFVSVYNYGFEVCVFFVGVFVECVY